MVCLDFQRSNRQWAGIGFGNGLWVPAVICLDYTGYGIQPVVECAFAFCLFWRKNDIQTAAFSRVTLFAEKLLLATCERRIVK